MNLYEHTAEQTFVELLSETMTNKYGTKFVWVRLCSGAEVSLTENAFNEQFSKSDS